MKYGLILLLLALVFVPTHAQNLDYSIHGKYEHPVRKEILMKAKTLADIIPYYPASWISSYTSTEILTIYEGRSVLGKGNNDTLNTEQINILNNADLGSAIEINVNYTFKNAVTGNPEIGLMHYTATVIPETEAEYPGGNTALTKYVKENAIDRISESVSNQFKALTIRFIVDEKGDVTRAQLSGTSGDPETDKILLETLYNMPGWKPAANANGTKVKQEFEFSVGKGGC